MATVSGLTTEPDNTDLQIAADFLHDGGFVEIAELLRNSSRVLMGGMAFLVPRGTADISVHRSRRWEQIIYTIEVVQLPHEHPPILPQSTNSLAASSASASTDSQSQG